MNIRQLKDSDGNVFAPRTHVEAVIDDKGNNIKDFVQSAVLPIKGNLDFLTLQNKIYGDGVTIRVSTQNNGVYDAYKVGNGTDHFNDLKIFYDSEIRIVYLTEAEYEALTPKDENTLYYIYEEES